jgi:predicted RNA-binding protein with PIN domain
MRFLIDGYNLMHALGLMGQKLGPTRFRKVRHRFLNDLAAALGTENAAHTTVVFDAREPPEGLPTETLQKGLRVVFVTDCDSADDRIEELIKADSAPKNLTVVSSDHRIQRAALRRKANALTSDAFWVDVSSRRPRTARTTAPPARPLDDQAQQKGPSPAQTEEWLRTFAHLNEDPDTAQALGNEDRLLSDDEIRRIEREVEEELP